MRVKPKEKTTDIFFKNFIGGVGWATGATIGFTILATLLGFILGKLGALPVAGNFFASIIEATNRALETRGFLK